MQKLVGACLLRRAPACAGAGRASSARAPAPAALCTGAMPGWSTGTHGPWAFPCSSRPPYQTRWLRAARARAAGTFAYAAPELLTGFKCNEKADIWCACCTRVALRVLCLERSVAHPRLCACWVARPTFTREAWVRCLSHTLQRQAAGARSNAGGSTLLQQRPCESSLPMTAASSAPTRSAGRAGRSACCCGSWRRARCRAAARSASCGALAAPAARAGPSMSPLPAW